jgi:hypothetical protein
MKGKTAAFVFLGICLILAILLFTNIISPIIGGIIFALALVLLGGISGGFRKR